ncbi:MAG: hypothetical protein EXS42_09800 [Lacunisphaera sp.]|nr:hypothetical protein [Lacunisphaera sp.]
MNLSPFAQLDIPPPNELVDLDARSRELIQESRLNDFKAKCPPEFLPPIKRALLSNLEAWDAADSWTSGTYPGLWLWSAETGRCKTRMAWRKIEQGIVKLGLRYVFTTGGSLADLCYQDFREGEPAEFVRRFKRYNLVVIDDVDKFPFADERPGRAFRDLFDYFYSQHVSVLVTSNEPIDYVAQRLGDSSERRIREVCRELRF